MKYMKILGLLAVAAAAFMAFAGIASATELTYKTADGTYHKLPAKSVIKAQNSAGTAPTLHSEAATVTCQKSTVEGEVTNAGGTGVTVSGPITALTFTECGNDTVTITKKGTLEIHTKNAGAADNTGTLTSSGAEATIQLHRTIFGFPVTTHCIYITNNTHIGEVTGSDHPKPPPTGYTTATIHADAELVEVDTAGTDCGAIAFWTATYEVTSPDHLTVH